MTLTAYGEGADTAVDAAVSYIEDMDARLSTGIDTSEISQINANGTGTLSADATAILEAALSLHAETDGAFNPLMYPLMEAWGFPTQNYCVPDAETLQALLPLTDCDALTLDPETGSVTLMKDGMQLDLGGIVKGYTSSAIATLFADNGVTSGIVSLGGNVQVMGTKPDGSLWRVGVQNPDSSGDYLGILEVQDKAVITSGGYERYFEQDGNTYHHILDPETGYPAQSGLISVTIVSEDGTLADGLSTALFVMGLDKAEAFWQAHDDTFDAIFQTDDGTLYVTAGIASAFSSSYDWNIIEHEEV
jgi:thiamine biosynthesis lipoprotein